MTKRVNKTKHSLSSGNLQAGKGIRQVARNQIQNGNRSQVIWAHTGESHRTQMGKIKEGSVDKASSQVSPAG